MDNSKRAVDDPEAWNRFAISYSNGKIEESLKNQGYAQEDIDEYIASIKEINI